MAKRVLTNPKQAAKSIVRSFGLEITRTQPVQNSVSVPPTLSPESDEATRWPNRPIAFVLVSSNHGTMIINRNDYRMVTQRDGFGFAFQILQSASYEFSSEVHHLLALLSNRRRFYGRGVVAIDCGANFGAHTVEWSRHMFGWGNVIAIEAQEKIYYALCGNVAINNCLNAKVIFAAVGSEVREILVPSPDYLQPASFGSLELRESKSNEFIGQKIDYQEANCTKIKQMTIDQLQLERVDLLKIDVEGMEADALAGAETTIRNHKPQLFVEWIKSDRMSIADLLNGWGYRHYVVGSNMLAIHELRRFGD